MKVNKLYIGLAVIAIAALGTYGATRAFFSDTETSTSNSFTAGSLEMRIAEHNSDASNTKGNSTLADWHDNRTLFTYADMMPGATGVGDWVLDPTVEAWACMQAKVTGNTNGMKDHMEIAYWKDLNGDGVINTGAEETSLASAPLSYLDTAGYLPLEDTSAVAFDDAGVPTDESYNVGYAYCFGNFETDSNGLKVTNGKLSCDGSSVTNTQMGGKVTGSVYFYAEQKANNPSFTCATTLNSTTIVVNSANQNGWYFYNDQDDSVIANSGDHGFVSGPGTPAAGTGSAHLTKTTNDKYGIATTQLVGMQLSDLTSLQYSTYRSTGTSAQVPSLAFDIDSDTTDGDTGYQGRLTYEPYFTHTVDTDTWQTWDTQDDAGTGNWWFSHATLSGGTASACTQSNPCTWTELNSNYPNLAISGQTIIRTNGADGEVFDGNADKLVVGTATQTQTFDFEN